MNPKLTPRERGLLKGALRRTFARSDLRNKALNNSIIANHTDPSRPRVKTWVKCAECGKPEAKSYAVVDHITPVIPIDSSFEDMSLDAVVDRLWCELDLLQVLCDTCHTAKTKAENKQRREIKNGKRSKVNKRGSETTRKRVASRRTSEIYRGTGNKTNKSKIRQNRKTT